MQITVALILAGIIVGSLGSLDHHSGLRNSQDILNLEGNIEMHDILETLGQLLVRGDQHFL